MLLFCPVKNDHWRFCKGHVNLHNKMPSFFEQIQQGFLEKLTINYL